SQLTLLRPPIVFSPPPPPPPSTPFPYTTLFRSRTLLQQLPRVRRLDSLQHMHAANRPNLLRRPRRHAVPILDDPLDPPLLLGARSEEHTSELQSRVDLVCRLLLEKKKT